MRRFLRILAGVGLVAAAVVIIRRVVTGGADSAPPPAPWKPLEADDVVQPAPTIVADEEPTVETDTGAAAGSVVPITGEDALPSDNGTGASPTNGDDDDADWVEANEDGSCPAPFPVKAKLSSKIFHVPGGMSYERTNADRCYLNEAAAEADGLRQAKR